MAFEAAEAAPASAGHRRNKSKGKAGGGASTTNPLQGADLAKISEDTSKLNRAVEKLKSMTAKLGSKEDTAKFRKKIKSHREKAQALAKDISHAISASKPPSRDARMRQAKAKVVKDFRVVLSEFEAAQKEELLLERQIIAQMSESIREGGASALEDAMAGDTSGGRDDGGGGGGAAQATVEFAEFSAVDEEIVKERAEEAEHLAKDAADLHELFVDLGTLVDEQGHDLDVMEANVDKAHDNTQKGVQELDEAVEQQKKYRRKQCCLLFLVLGMLLALTFGIIAGTSGF